MPLEHVFNFFQDCLVFFLVDGIEVMRSSSQRGVVVPVVVDGWDLCSLGHLQS